MEKRKIIKIDENKCNGCGLCIPNCPEGALQVIDRVVRLVSDLFCDGLGACIGHCPQGAITIEERDAEEYNEQSVMKNIVKQGKNVINAHLEHLKSHGEHEYLQEALAYLRESNMEIPCESKPGHTHGFGGCPGSRVLDFRKTPDTIKVAQTAGRSPSELRQWPVQISLVPAHAPYFNGADLLIAADCVPFAYPDFHRDLLKGKVLLVGCPKLDDIEVYKEKIAQIMADNDIKSITYAHMEVPCCLGLIVPIQEAIERSGRNIPLEDVVISLRGEVIKK